MDPVVILGTDSVSAGPGEQVRVPVRVRNLGRRVESYRIDVVGEPARYCEVDPASVSVLPGREAEVAVTFQPPVGASTPTGTFSFGVRATSEVRSTSSAVAEGRLEVTGAAGLQAWPERTAVAGRWSARYRLAFANHGNASVRLAVTAHDPTSSLALRVGQDVVDVPPGGRATADVRAKARRPFLRGTTLNRPFQVACHDLPFGASPPEPGQTPPPDDPHSRTFQLTFDQKPVLSRGAMVIGVLALVLVVALVALRLRGGDDVVLAMARPDPPPTFTAQPQDSTRVFLSWARVPNATGYDIRTTTADGAVFGPPLDHVDASATQYVVEGLGPGETFCYAVEATGPEGVDKSPRSESACATTEATPQVAPPVDLVVTPIGAGSFQLQWSYPEPIDDLTFSVFVDNVRVLDVAGLFTSLDLPRRELTHEATIAVKAVRADQTSDFSNPQRVTVEAMTSPTAEPPPTTSSDTEAGDAGDVGDEGDVGDVGDVGGVDTTVITPPVDPREADELGEGDATTTVPAPPTTAGPPITVTTQPLPPPAQGALRDHEATWIAMLDPVHDPPVGPGEDVQRQLLATDFEIAPDLLLTFSTRDTATTDADGAPDVLMVHAAPHYRFFYTVQQDEAAAVEFCGDDVRCRPVHLEGAARAAEGTHVALIERRDPTTLVSQIDARLQQLRSTLGRSSVFALDGSTRAQFGDEVVIFASGFADADSAADFCIAMAVPTCSPVLLQPDAP